MKTTLLLLLLAVTAHAQDQELERIRKVMSQQQEDWNKGNLVAFMQGYWNSDSLRFISSRGVNYGWQATLSGYQKGYPSKEAMGTLTFTILSLEKLSDNTAFMIGKWHLKRKADEPNSHFTLLWKKIKGQWVIVADHTSWQEFVSLQGKSSYRCLFLKGTRGRKVRATKSTAPFERRELRSINVS